MNKLLITALLVLFTANAGADDLDTRMKSLEDGHELNASALRLPANATGTLDIKNCQECVAQTMEIDANTRFFIGDSQVTLGEMRDFLNGHPGKAVLVVTPAGKKQVSRIVASGKVNR
jgi:hypothetical protein